MPDLRTLYDNPVATGRQFAIRIQGMGATTKKVDAESSLTLMQVKASLSVGASCTADAEKLTIEAGVSSGSVANVYFLPWAKQCIYRIRLKPANTAGMNENLFFTPNLDGCMVSITGTQDAPTVYHANASGSPLTPEEDLAMRNPASPPNIENHLKITKMVSGVNAFEQVKPKVGLLLKRKDFDLLEYDKGSKTTILDPLDTGRDRPQMFMKDYHGAVFGVRKNGLWVFYKQSHLIHKVQAYQEKKPFFPWGDPTEEFVSFVKYSVSSFDQYWP